jgi:hypothetical protein
MARRSLPPSGWWDRPFNDSSVPWRSPTGENDWSGLDEADEALEASGGQDGVVITLGNGGGKESAPAADEAFFEGGDAPARPVTARILWPAAGFPAVIAPRANATGSPLSQGDATRCITVLLLSDWKFLGKEEAAKYLRWVRWKDRGKRHIPEGQEGSFRWQDLEVRNDAGTPGLYHMTPKDVLGELIGWGGDQEHTHAVAGNLADAVTKFYRGQNLQYLHEIRVSEAASAALGTGKFHLFWNNRSTEENAPSDEMALLLAKFTPGRRADVDPSLQRFKGYFQDEYEYQFRPMHPAEGPEQKGPRSEILHPVCIRKPGKTRLRVGHLTDLHVAVRGDLYQRNLEAVGTRAKYNNWKHQHRRVLRRRGQGRRHRPRHRRPDRLRPRALGSGGQAEHRQGQPLPRRPELVLLPRSARVW